MRFEFLPPARILFGPGCFSDSLSTIEKLGKRIFLVTGMGSQYSLPYEEKLRGRNLETLIYQVPHEPTVDLVQRGVDLAKQFGAEAVIGLGGGSAIDTAKAVAGLTTNPGPVVDYLEVVGKGAALTVPALPLAAIPTTAGTGTEVTKNAVVAVPEKKVKVSLRSPFLIPRLAVVDPELTLSLPEDITASTGMDALAQVLEPFVSNRANWLVDGFCREGLKRAGRSLFQAYQHGDDRAAREDMSYTSLMGGLALANAGLGAVHGFAAPLGGMYPAAHGVLCARLLGAVVRVNVRAMESRLPDHPALHKYTEAARLIMGDSGVEYRMLADWLDDLCERMRIPRLADIGVGRGDFNEIADKALVASSMQANPIQLEKNELLEILGMAL